jgi:glucokinase
MADERSFLVIDLGGTRVRAASAACMTLRLTHRREEPTEIEGGPDGVIAQMVRLGRSVLEESGEAARVGVSALGPLDSRSGVVYSPPNLPGWKMVPLAARLEQALGLPTTIVNDANAAALGEFYAGSGRGHRNMVYFTISTGIGGGVIADGRLLEGSCGMGGELGHMTIDRHGPICNCGNVGCLEVLASGTSIARRFNERLSAGERSIVSEWTVGRPATAADVSRGAQLRDPLASAIFTDAAECIGVGVVNAIHVFNPELVVLGGGVAQAPGLFDIVRSMVERYAQPAPRRAARIVPAELRGDEGLIGAAAVAREQDKHSKSGIL